MSVSRSLISLTSTVLLVVALGASTSLRATTTEAASDAVDGAQQQPDREAIARLLMRRALRQQDVEAAASAAEAVSAGEAASAAEAPGLVGAALATMDVAIEKFMLERNLLISATGKNDVLLLLKRGKKNVEVKKVALGKRLKPQGIAFNSHCEYIAIANGRSVLLINAWEGRLRVLGDDGTFGNAKDVAFDMECNLIVADTGLHAVGRWPRDGRLWLYEIETGNLREIGLRHHNWINPAYLDMDVEGNLYVVDEEAGRAMPGTGNEMFFDAIYKLGMPEFRWGKAIFKGKGLTATAFMVHPQGGFWVGRGTDFVIIDARTMKLTEPCGKRTPFTWVTGIAVDTNLDVIVIDGFSVFGTTRVHRIDAGCNVFTLGKGAQLFGAQGLAVALPAR